MSTNEDFSPLSAQKPVLAKTPSSVVGTITPSGYRFFDNSTLDYHRVCHRKGYFRNVRQWEPSGVRVPLVFGSAMHAAQDVIWKLICTEKVHDPKVLIQLAMEGFDKVWTQHNMQNREEMDLYPRSPGRAQQILDLYIQRYIDELSRIELLEIETPFIVPLDIASEMYFYIGKWDKVFRNMAGIQILDHKTSSSFASTWQESFSPNGQMDGYLYSGQLTYGDEFDMVWIDGLLVQKTNVDVQRIPLKRQISQLDAWQWETAQLIDEIEYNEEQLNDYRNSGTRKNFLPAFPKCTTSCTQYYGKCPYLDLCKYWDNPEDHKECPEGFVENKWEPFAITEDLNGTFKITPKEEAE